MKEYIPEESYAGGSYDGAYFHAQHVNDSFNVKDEDAMHRSCLAEKRARKKEEKMWVNKLGKILQKLLKIMIMERKKKYEEVGDQADLMEIELSEPKFHREIALLTVAHKYLIRDIKIFLYLYQHTKKCRLQFTGLKR